MPGTTPQSTGGRATGRRGRVLRRLADLRVDFLDETGAFIEAQPFSTAVYADRTALMHATRPEGVEL